MKIEIVFDPVCPWCYIGLGRLDQALSARPQLQPVLRWRPFLLNPDIPEDGVSRKEYLERKFGSPQRARRMIALTEQTAREDGLPVNLNQLDKIPSSVAAHRLIQWADGAWCQTQLVRALFAAYFRDGLDIGAIPVLVQLAHQCGLSASEALTFLNSTAGQSAVEADNHKVHRQGVTGVPCFIFADQFAMAGAQDVEVLIRMLDIACDIDSDGSRFGAIPPLSYLHDIF